MWVFVDMYIYLWISVCLYRYLWISLVFGYLWYLDMYKYV